MVEEWKEIKGFEGLYSVSNIGRVKSLLSNKILKGNLSDRGYIKVKLTNNKVKRTLRVHQLVAQAFIPNPNNYTEINHIDEDKTNNEVSNLEWCNHSYNCNYGTRGIKAKETKGKKVKLYKIKVTTSYEYVDTFDTCTDAAKYIGATPEHVNECAHGYVKQVKGFKAEFL